MSDSEKPKGSWRDCMKTIEHKWHAPIVFIEWVCWRISPFLRQLSFLEVLEYLSRLAVLIAVIFYIWGCEDRQKAKHFQAWQVINSAQGKPGSGGRIDALQDLNGDDVSLAGVDISNANLRGINLENADLSGANFAEAKLPGANLTGANLYYANLTGADLWGVNFTRADLLCANLTGADLWDANLTGAALLDANLDGAYLEGANLKDIERWQEIESIEYANIYGVENPPEGFIDWAKEQGAVEIEDRKEWIEYKQKKMQEKVNEKQ